jgi:hypothetical protein
MILYHIHRGALIQKAPLFLLKTDRLIFNLTEFSLFDK